MTSHPALRSRPGRALSVGLASALALGALGFISPAAQAAGEPTVTVSETSFTEAETATVTVTGTGFNPGDAIATRPPLAPGTGGVYIAAGKFAEVWRPSASAASSTRKTLAAPDGLHWAIPAERIGEAGLGVQNGAIPLNEDGTFTAEITLSKSLLDAISGLTDTHVNYGIYVYPGGGASNASWEKYIPITFTPAPELTDYALTVTTLTLDKDGTTFGAAAKATATVKTKGGEDVTGGRVQLSGHGATQIAQVTNGKVTFDLPKGTAVGTHTLIAEYSGRGVNLASTSTTRLKVAKAKASAKVAVTTKPTSKKTGAGALTIQGAADVVAPSGTASVRFTKGKSTKTVTVTLADGQAAVKIPKLKKGTWKVTVKYNGDAQYNSFGYTKTGSIKVKK